MNSILQHAPLVTGLRTFLRRACKKCQDPNITPRMIDGSRAGFCIRRGTGHTPCSSNHKDPLWAACACLWAGAQAYSCAVKAYLMSTVISQGVQDCSYASRHCPRCSCAVNTPVLLCTRMLLCCKGIRAVPGACVGHGWQPEPAPACGRLWPNLWELVGRRARINNHTPPVLLLCPVSCKQCEDMQACRHAGMQACSRIHLLGFSCAQLSVL
jgi:hypothetical protein